MGDCKNVRLYYEQQSPDPKLIGIGWMDSFVPFRAIINQTCLWGSKEELVLLNIEFESNLFIMDWLLNSASENKGWCGKDKSNCLHTQH
jgi:hypothetical protein